ncbi:uncharacterized protein LOC116337154 [Contarinia nasturtii]|uniref:uncharacterized protein LOC116337154 n=1 Tax=Contarinia nasturtii TaxID=265458 RepID=UPI0012D3C348|nr:uncharacterized protein LOC116337154 [Contarinia nasturtii]
MKNGLWMCVVLLGVVHGISTDGIEEINANTCCNVDNTKQKEYDEKLEQLMKDCIEDLGLANQRKEKQHEAFICVIECVGKKLNVIDDKKQLNKDNLRNFVLNDMPLEDHQRSIADSTIEKCTEMAKTTANDVNGCSDIILKVNACLESEFFKSCPADKQIKSDECAKLRETVNKA